MKTKLKIPDTYREICSRLQVLMVFLLFAFGANANDYISVGLFDANSDVEEQALIGDVNGDSIVSIGDVTALIDLLLLGETTSCADVNGDGIVSISDVTTLIDMLLFDISPSEPETPTIGDAPSILILGNSFTCDSWMYLPFILKSYGINIKVGIWYVSGGSLGGHVTYYNTAPAVKHDFYLIDTANDTVWNTITDVLCAQDAVKYAPWDIITLQQNSTSCTSWTTFEAGATNLMALIDVDKTNPDMRYAWNINHTRMNNDYPADVLANVLDITTEKDIDIVFPYGTAIFNARKDTTLAAIGAGTNLWCNDYQHLQDGLPCYIASLANVQVIFDTWFPEKNLSVIGDPNRTNVSWTRGKGMKDQQIPHVGISDENCALAQQYAFAAARNKFAITGGWDKVLKLEGSSNYTLEINSAWSEITANSMYYAPDSGENPPELNVVITPKPGNILTKCSSRNLRGSVPNETILPDSIGKITVMMREVAENWNLYIQTAN
ncbi:MAG: DUF4886 domain-containing protein [Muribaculaceae bacterium]|nr:DUF4886 domain-containing protein [Muribaculaceae bacterium]